MIYLGADHGGYELKEKIKHFLKQSDYQFKDLGNLIYEKEDDYPDYAFAVAQMVSKEDNVTKPWKQRPKGILMCRSAGGVIIAANKVNGVRAVAVFDTTSAKHSREHNDANIIALSGDWIDETKAKEIVKVWLDTEYSREERHTRRLNKIRDYENRRK
jgi:ribose 5-phosphate isomerase B